MIWLDIKKMENLLAKNKLSDKASFDYFLATLILGIIFINDIADTKSVWTEWLYCILAVLITILGVNAVFKVNNSGDGKDFFKRFFSIGWLFGFRLFLLIIIIDLSIGFIEGLASEINNNIKRVTENLFLHLRTPLSLLGYVIFYYLLMNSVRRVNKKRALKKSNEEENFTGMRYEV